MSGLYLDAIKKNLAFEAMAKTAVPNDDEMKKVGVEGCKLVSAYTFAV